MKNLIVCLLIIVASICNAKEITFTAEDASSNSELKINKVVLTDTETGRKYTIENDFTVDIDYITGVKNNTSISERSISPNPSLGSFSYNFSTKDVIIGSISLFCIDGRRVFSEYLTLEPGGYSIDFNCNGLKDGAYIIAVNSYNFQSSAPLIISGSKNMPFEYKISVSKISHRIPTISENSTYIASCYVNTYVVSSKTIDFSEYTDGSAILFLLDSIDLSEYKKITVNGSFTYDTLGMTIRTIRTKLTYDYNDSSWDVNLRLPGFPVETDTSFIISEDDFYFLMDSKGKKQFHIQFYLSVEFDSLHPLFPIQSYDYPIGISGEVEIFEENDEILIVWDSLEDLGPYNSSDRIKISFHDNYIDEYEEGDYKYWVSYYPYKELGFSPNPNENINLKILFEKME